MHSRFLLAGVAMALIMEVSSQESYLLKAWGMKLIS
jgi:hypothetical protein